MKKITRIRLSDLSPELTKEEIEIIEKSAKTPIAFDNDSPMLMDEELSQFKRVNDIHKVQQKSD